MRRAGGAQPSLPNAVPAVVPTTERGEHMVLPGWCRSSQEPGLNAAHETGKRRGAPTGVLDTQDTGGQEAAGRVGSGRSRVSDGHQEGRIVPTVRRPQWQKESQRSKGHTCPGSALAALAARSGSTRHSNSANDLFLFGEE